MVAVMSCSYQKLRFRWCLPPSHFNIIMILIIIIISNTSSVTIIFVIVTIIIIMAIIVVATRSIASPILLIS